MNRTVAAITEMRHALSQRLSMTGTWAKAHYAALERCRDTAARILGRSEGLRVLDLGCGRVPHATMVFTAWKWHATGIDIGPVEGTRFSKLAYEVRTEGMLRATKSLARQLIVEPTYYRELESCAGVPLRNRRLDIRPMSACDMTFPDGEFDLIYSMSVLEHIDDVPRALDEVHRVLKDDGLIYISFSPYHSLTGGHSSAWFRVRQGFIPKDVPAWDHLREQRFPNPVYLNKLRVSDYRAELDKRFEILEWRLTQEGIDLLTPAIRAELAAYTEEELTTRTVTVVARKRAIPPP